MMPHAIQHYQCCFRIEDPMADKMHLVQKTLFDWICSKEDDRELKSGWSEFKFEANWRSLFRSRSSVQTCTCLEDGGNSWALQYEERDKEHGPKRFWYTEVGVRQLKSCVVVFSRVSYAWNQTDLTNFQVAPTTSIPKFVRLILGGTSKVYCIRPEFRLTGIPTVLKLGFGKGVDDWVRSSERKHPLIIFNGSSQALINESEYMAKSLVGKCQVLRIPEDKELAEEIRCFLPKDYSTPFGGFRVFFPVPPNETSTQRHRWYNVSEADYSEQRGGIIYGLLRNFTVFDNDSVECLADVRRRIKLVKLERFKKENPDRTKELTDFYELLSETEKARDDAKNLVDHFAVECDARDSEIRALKRQIALLVEKAKGVSFAKQKEEFIRTFKKLPESLSDLVEAYSKLHSDRIVFAAAAISGARDYARFEGISQAWTLFHDLTHLIYEMKFSEDGAFSGDWEKAFDDVSTFELTMTESSATKKNAAIMAKRQINYGGIEYDITPHLKWGSREPKMLRVHFAFDETSRRIVVGYIGPHMETAGTRRSS